VRFGGYAGRLSAEREGVVLDMQPPNLRRVNLQALADAFAVVSVHIASASAEPAAAFEKRMAELSWNSERMEWTTPEGVLRLDFARKPGPVDTQDRVFAEYRNGSPVPLTRLSGERLI
jgi:hypothetical protein